MTKEEKQASTYYDLCQKHHISKGRGKLRTTKKQFMRIVKGGDENEN